MTINSEVKDELKQKELEHEHRWRKQQTVQAIKGGLIIIALVLGTILIPLIYQ
jgi:hypothetical protein